MQTILTPNVQPLYTFQNRSGDFVDVLARAEYQGEQLDLTTTTKDGHTRYFLEGTSYDRTSFGDLAAAAARFDAERLVTLARKFGTYEVAKK